MSSVTATERQTMRSGETRNIAVSFVPKLDSGELLTGTPTVTASPAGPTISSIARNSATITISGRSVLASQGVQFKVGGATAGTEYALTVKCGTDQGQLALEVECILIVD